MKNSNNQTSNKVNVNSAPDDATKAAYIAATIARREAEKQPSKQHDMPIVSFEENGTPIYREEQ